MAIAKTDQPANVPSAAILVWLTMLVVCVGAATMLGYQTLLSSHGVDRLRAVRGGVPDGVLRATSGRTGDIAREQAELLADARRAAETAKR